LLSGSMLSISTSNLLERFWSSGRMGAEEMA
jgi:hypothetical protein